MKDKTPNSSKANRYSPNERPPSFERAVVPEYLLQLEIDSIPANTPYFIDTESEQSWNDSPTMLVDKRTGALYLDGSAELDADSHTPASPLGLVGIMRAERVTTIDNTDTVVSYFIADLRFIENHELSTITDIEDSPTDQEDLNNWMEFKKTLRPVSAFIAPTPGAKASKDGIIPSLYYGPEEQYGMLDALRKRGDKLLAKKIKKARRAAKLAQAVITPKNSVDQKEAPEKETSQSSRNK